MRKKHSQFAYLFLFINQPGRKQDVASEGKDNMFIKEGDLMNLTIDVL